jgi:hypothetical protein
VLVLALRVKSSDYAHRTSIVAPSSSLVAREYNTHMDPFQDAGSSQSQPNQYYTDDHMATTPGAGRKRVGFTSDAPRSFSTTSPEGGDTGSGGHNTPLHRPDVTQDDLKEMRESLRIALAEEYTQAPPPPQDPASDAASLPRDVQKPRPAIRKGPKTPPEFYLNDLPNPFDDDNEIRPSPAADLKQRSGLEAHRRAARLSKSVGTYSAPVSRRNSQEAMSPPVELQNMARGFDYVNETVDEENDPQFMKRASMILRQHTVNSLEPGSITQEGFYHTDVPLRSGQVTPETMEVEDERVKRPTKYRTGVLGTLLRANSAQGGPGPAARLTRPSHLRNISAGTFSGASTAANSPHSSPPASGYSTPRAGRPWFRQQNNPSGTSISQLVGSSAQSFATPAQRELGQEFDEQVKKTAVRPGMGKRSKSDDSVLPFRRARKRDDEIKIKIHL